MRVAKALHAASEDVVIREHPEWLDERSEFVLIEASVFDDLL